MGLTSKTSYFRIFALITLFCFSSMTLQGCASGGFKLTRSLAKWNNSLPTVFRVIIYLAFIAIPIYLATIVVDIVALNTIDFWEGKVSAQNMNYEKDGIHYAVQHSKDPLRKTSILATFPDKTQSLIEIKETVEGKIELYIDGVRRGEASDFKDLSLKLTLYNETGENILVDKTMTHELLTELAKNPNSLIRQFDFVKSQTSIIARK